MSSDMEQKAQEQLINDMKMSFERKELLEWAKKRKYEETEHRPDINIYKRVLIDTWDQVIKKLSEV